MKTDAPEEARAARRAQRWVIAIATTFALLNLAAVAYLLLRGD